MVDSNQTQLVPNMAHNEHVRLAYMHSSLFGTPNPYDAACPMSSYLNKMIVENFPGKTLEWESFLKYRIQI